MLITPPFVLRDITCLTRIQVIFWDKISYSLTKYHTYVRKVGHTSEFLFSIYWWTLKNPKKSDFWKNEKMCWRYHFAYVYRKPYEVYSSWDMKWDRFVCYFGPFFALLTSSPLTTQKTKIFKKMKKVSGDIIILNLCINPSNAFWKGLMLYWLNVKNNSNHGVCLFRQKKILRSSRNKNLQNQNNEVLHHHQALLYKLKIWKYTS